MNTKKRSKLFWSCREEHDRLCTEIVRTSAQTHFKCNCSRIHRAVRILLINTSAVPSVRAYERVVNITEHDDLFPATTILCWLPWQSECKQNCEVVCNDYGTSLQVDDDLNYAICGLRNQKAKKDLDLCGYVDESNAHAAYECCGLKPGPGPEMDDCKYDDPCGDGLDACVCACNLKA